MDLYAAAVSEARASIRYVDALLLHFCFAGSTLTHFCAFFFHFMPFTFSQSSLVLGASAVEVGAGGLAGGCWADAVTATAAARPNASTDTSFDIVPLLG